MLWLIWILLHFRLGLHVAAHVRLAEVSSTTWRSFQMFPQQQWQARNVSTSTAKPLPVRIEQNMQLELVNLTRQAAVGVYCEAQDFAHSYEVKGDLDDQLRLRPHANRFERTRSGEFATMRDLCLDQSGLPVRRMCKVINATTATWSPLESVTCRAGNELSQRISRLRQELNAAQHSKPVVLTKLRHLLAQAHGQPAPVDVYSTAQIFASLYAEGQQVNATLSAGLIGICRQIMSSDAEVLQLSAQLNATNLLLSKFEQYMDTLPEQLVPPENCGKPVGCPECDGAAENAVEIINLAAVGVQALITNNLSVFYVNPLCDNITGIAVYSAAAPDRRHSVSGFWYRLLHANESVEQLRQQSELQSASFVPDSLWQHLQRRGASHLVLKIYAHDALFVETSNQRRRRPYGPVLSITIPEVESKYLN